jgi:hypothetical protein
MKHLTAVVGSMGVLLGTAQAADQNGEFALKGAGFLPCQVYVQERENKSSVYYMIGGWLEGYLSAHNRYADQTYDVTSFETLELLLGVIQNHCQSNPNDRLYSVLNSIIIQLQADRVMMESPKVAIAEGERQTQLYRDGRYTDATRSALIAFQSDIEFETSGFPDQATLWRLFRD